MEDLKKIEKLSIIIPVYNEEKTIRQVYNKIMAVKFPIEREIVIVNDCSNDGTEEELKKIKNENKKENLKIIHHEKNLGRGGAIRTAINHISGDYTLMQDADLEYDPVNIPNFINFIKKEKFDVVYGSRIFNNKEEKSYLPYYLGNMFLNKVTSFLYWTKIVDMETCYKMIPTEILKGLKLRSDGFNLEPEITAKIIRKGYKIGYVPINFKPRSVKEGKKVKFTDGFHALKALIYWRFYPRDKL